jgi:chaperonin GroEL
MSIELQFGDDATNKLIEGSRLIKEAVAATLGPRGKNVAIDREWGVPRVVHDGVTVARSIKLPDRDMDMGAMLMQEAADRTNNEAGDGTTTSIIMAHAIFSESVKYLVAGSSSMMIRKGINKAQQAVDAELKKMAKPVESEQDTAMVATISAQDEEIGKLINKAIKKVGNEGVITVDESDTSDITVEYKAGMQFDEGLVSPWLVTDERIMESAVDKPQILITDYPLSNAQQIIKVLDRVIGETSNTKFFIVAKDFSGGALQDLINNHRKGAIQAILVKAPHSGDRQTKTLEDIAIYTGANFISESKGDKLDNVTAEDFGSAKRVVSGRQSTVIVDGAGKKEEIADRIEMLTEDIKDVKTREYDRKFLEERKAKLSSGIAVIKVGASSEAEKDERKERVIDAVSATRAAIAEGIVPGGETALLRASMILKSLKLDDPEEKMGVDIVYRACQAPFKRLMENAGIDSGYAMAKIEGTELGMGYNVNTLEIEDLVKAGVVDPVKVTRSALRNATSTATMLITTSVLVVNKKEDNTNARI